MSLQCFWQQHTPLGGQVALLGMRHGSSTTVLHPTAATVTQTSTWIGASLVAERTRWLMPHASGIAVSPITAAPTSGGNTGLEHLGLDDGQPRCKLGSCFDTASALPRWKPVGHTTDKEPSGGTPREMTHTWQPLSSILWVGGACPRLLPVGQSLGGRLMSSPLLSILLTLSGDGIPYDPQVHCSPSRGLERTVPADMLALTHHAHHANGQRAPYPRREESSMFFSPTVRAAPISRHRLRPPCFWATPVLQAVLPHLLRVYLSQEHLWSTPLERAWAAATKRGDAHVNLTPPITKQDPHQHRQYAHMHTQAMTRLRGGSSLSAEVLSNADLLLLIIAGLPEEHCHQFLSCLAVNQLFYRLLINRGGVLLSLAATLPLTRQRALNRHIIQLTRVPGIADARYGSVVAASVVDAPFPFRADLDVMFEWKGELALPHSNVLPVSFFLDPVFELQTRNPAVPCQQARFSRGKASALFGSCLGYLSGYHHRLAHYHALAPARLQFRLSESTPSSALRSCLEWVVPGAGERSATVLLEQFDAVQRMVQRRIPNAPIRVCFLLYWQHTQGYIPLTIVFEICVTITYRRHIESGPRDNNEPWFSDDVQLAHPCLHRVTVQAGATRLRALSQPQPRVPQFTPTSYLIHDTIQFMFAIRQGVAAAIPVEILRARPDCPSHANLLEQLASAHLQPVRLRQGIVYRLIEFVFNERHLSPVEQNRGGSHPSNVDGDGPSQSPSFHNRTHMVLRAIRAAQTLQERELHANRLIALRAQPKTASRKAVLFICDQLLLGQEPGLSQELPHDIGRSTYAQWHAYIVRSKGMQAALSLLILSSDRHLLPVEDHRGGRHRSTVDKDGACRRPTATLGALHLRGGCKRASTATPTNDDIVKAVLSNEDLLLAILDQLPADDTASYMASLAVCRFFQSSLLKYGATFVSISTEGRQQARDYNAHGARTIFRLRQLPSVASSSDSKLSMARPNVLCDILPHTGGPVLDSICRWNGGFAPFGHMMGVRSNFFDNLLPAFTPRKWIFNKAEMKCLFYVCLGLRSLQYSTLRTEARLQLRSFADEQRRSINLTLPTGGEKFAVISETELARVRAFRAQRGRGRITFRLKLFWLQSESTPACPAVLSFDVDLQLCCIVSEPTALGVTPEWHTFRDPVIVRIEAHASSSRLEAFINASNQERGLVSCIPVPPAPSRLAATCIRSSPLHGRGLFAVAEPIQPDTVVACMIIQARGTFQHCLSRALSKGLPHDAVVAMEGTYAFTDLAWDESDEVPPPWYCMNHADVATANVQMRIINPHAPVRLRRLAWVATRLIAVGEELCFPYGQPDPDWSTPQPPAHTSPQLGPHRRRTRSTMLRQRGSGPTSMRDCYLQHGATRRGGDQESPVLQSNDEPHQQAQDATESPEPSVYHLQAPVPLCSAYGVSDITWPQLDAQILTPQWWKQLRLHIKTMQSTWRRPPPAAPQVPPIPTAQFLRCWERSAEALQEFQSFAFPLTEVSEVKRLLACKHIAPTWLMLGDVSMSMTAAVEQHRGVNALMVDRQRPQLPGLTFCGDFSDIIPLAFWECVCAWPSCTHISMADTLCRDAKIQDGRMFFACLGVLYVYAAPTARAVFVEQPNVWLLAFINFEYTRLLPPYYGDKPSKTFNIFSRNLTFPPGYIQGVGDWSRKPLSAFDNAEEAANWRSSWAHYPNMVAHLAHGMQISNACRQINYEGIARRFARAWQAMNLPLPQPWFSPAGLPPTSEQESYLLQRGAGLGEQAPLVVTQQPTPPKASIPANAIERLVDMRSLQEGAVVLVMLAWHAQPVIFAALNGFHVIGAQLPSSWQATPAPMHLAQAWARQLLGARAAACIFFAGAYTHGPRIAVLPTTLQLQSRDVIVSPAQRRAGVERGISMAWCTLAALSLTACADLAARVVTASQAFISPISHLPDEVTSSLAFSFGKLPAQPLDATWRPTTTTTSWEGQLVSDASAMRVARVALLSDKGPMATYLAELAYQIHPPPYDEVPQSFQHSLPNFANPELLDYPFTTPIAPLHTPWLPRKPQQQLLTDACPDTPLDILEETCKPRILRWLDRNLQHLRCMADTGGECAEIRPRPAVFGQQCVVAWARGVVWDFTKERSTCGVPLNYSLPIDTHLNIKFLQQELADYPDRRLLSHLLEGVRFEADVELHAVFNPHLLSLSKALPAVTKELLRLESNGWYHFFNALPFWPIYINGQGSTPRKYVIGRDRRTTEGGGPRNEVFDEEGLRALSINEAVVTFHLPSYYARDEHLAAWATQARKPHVFHKDGSPAKLPKERKPTLAQVAADLAVLKAAAHFLGEPVYVFGDDAADYFNQLAIASEDWWLLGCAFITTDDIFAHAYRNGAQPNKDSLVFVSERRLGFGMTSASNIAQRFSDALLHIFRRHMDAAEEQAGFTEKEQQWRQKREAVAERLAHAEGRDLQEVVLEQSRLYVIHCYSDDPLLAVVGIARAIRLVKTWRSLTLNVGLIMAAAVKRTFGVVCMWLGILIFAGLGLLVTPKDKLLRTRQGLSQALTSHMPFGDYRAFVGMLEHIRTITCLSRAIMHGLYEPHADMSLVTNPNATVTISVRMRRSLEKWSDKLALAAAAPFLSVLRKASALLRPMPSIKFIASADAATDSHVPGMGGFCHGLFWYLPLHPEWLRWLHIGVLELLATGFNAIIFGRYVQHAELVLQSDALLTPYVLLRQREKADLLLEAHHLLLEDQQFALVAQKALIAHLSGDCNAFADAISRAEWERLSHLASALHIKLSQVQVPARLVEIIDRLVAHARAAGREVNRQQKRPPPPLPPQHLQQVFKRMKTNAPSTCLRQRGSGSNSDDGWQAAFADLVGSRVPETRAEPGTSVLDSSDITATTMLHARLTGARSPGQTPPTPQPMATVQISGLSIPRSAQRPASVHHPAPTLRAAAGVQAERRAQRLAASSFGQSVDVTDLVRLLAHASDLAEYGAAHGTLKKDELVWQRWDAFAQLVGFDPHVSHQQATQEPDHLATILALFMLHVYSRLKGRSGRTWAKPGSAFAYVLGIIRIFARWKIIFPAAKVVKAELRGLLRTFVTIHGKSALQPRRREPLSFNMLCALTSMQTVTRANGVAFPPHAIAAFKRMLVVGWYTGHRLAEFVSHPSGETVYLTRADISWMIGGVLVCDPTPQQLALLQNGDYVLITPSRSKTDQFGDIHSPFPSVLPFNTASRINPAEAIANIELQQPCRGTVRNTTPLFADEFQRPYEHNFMDSMLHLALTYLYGAAIASVHSWHSLRSGLASALRAAGCPDEIIQLICRWMNPESLRAYARVGARGFVNWLGEAETAVVDARQTANMPRIDNTEGFVAIQQEYNAPIPTRAQAVLNAKDSPSQAQLSPACMPSTPQKLTEHNCVGRCVLVPRRLWPNYPCTEHDGAGWEASVTAFNAPFAEVHFQHATTSEGTPYEPVQLRLNVLRPL